MATILSSVTIGSLYSSHPRQWLYSPRSYRTTCWPAPMLLFTSAQYYYPAAPARRGQSRAAAPQNNWNAGLGRKVVGTVLSTMLCFNGPVLPTISLRPNHRLSPFPPSTNAQYANASAILLRYGKCTSISLAVICTSDYRRMWVAVVPDYPQ